MSKTDLRSELDQAKAGAFADKLPVGTTVSGCISIAAQAPVRSRVERTVRVLGGKRIDQAVVEVFLKATQPCAAEAARRANEEAKAKRCASTGRNAPRAQCRRAGL